MNFKINNINFGAQYYVYGKQTPQKTMKAYDNEIATKEYRLKTAVQGQEYMETPLVQDYLDWIPEDTFVRLHTGVLDGEGKRKDEFLDFNPYLSFETNNINEQIQFSKNNLGVTDTLELTLNEFGVLDKKKINNWFEGIIEFYSHTK